MKIVITIIKSGENMLNKKVMLNSKDDIDYSQYDIRIKVYDATTNELIQTSTTFEEFDINNYGSPSTDTNYAYTGLPRYGIQIEAYGPYAEYTFIEQDWSPYVFGNTYKFVIGYIDGDSFISLDKVVPNVTFITEENQEISSILGYDYISSICDDIVTWNNNLVTLPTWDIFSEKTTTLYNPRFFYNLEYKLSSSYTYKTYFAFTGYLMCLSIDTTILLADGTTKLYKDITIDDELLVWDFDNGCYTTAKLLWLQDIQLADHYFKCTTNTGKVLNCIGDNNKSHRLFSIDKNRFEYPQDIVGDTIYTTDGYEQLVSVEKINEPIYYRNAITNYHINLFGNSILTSCRLNNIYPIENMKFIKDNRELKSREEFNELSDSVYYGLRLSEQPISKEELVKYIDNLYKSGNVV